MGVDRLLPWLRRSGWAYLLLAAALALVAWRLGGPGGSGQPEGAPAAQVRGGPVRPKQVLVHVAGAVRRPGVYPIGGDGRVIQAVRLAGGPTRRADLSGLNLAATVQDGQQVVVPVRTPAGATATGATGAPGPVSLSSASVEQLDALDGIGPTLAARIVEWRRQNGGFASVEQLQEVPGIGEGRLEALRGHVVP